MKRMHFNNVISRSVVFVVVALVIMITNRKLIRGWNFTTFNITDDNYYIGSVSFFGSNRLFLTLPRSKPPNNHFYPTLLEIKWSPYKSIKIPFVQYQEWGSNCNQIQDAISVVTIRTRLLIVLDKGNTYCPPKIILFNIVQNELIQMCDLETKSAANLSTLVVDTDGPYGHRLYVGYKDLPQILIFGINDFKWWRINLEGAISTQFLALSNRHHQLYISGEEPEAFYSLDLEQIRNDEGPLPIEAHEVIVQMQVTFLGPKLGWSSGLIADAKNGLTYYLIRDYAIVRWTIGTIAQAENYNVLGQSASQFPFVTQFVDGPKNSIWAVINSDRFEEVNGNSNRTKIRLRMVLKYSKIPKTALIF